MCGSCQTPLCPLTLALISTSTSSQLAAATVVILMPHATPKGTGVEGQAPSKEEPKPLKAFDIWKPWKAVPATPRASIRAGVEACVAVRVEDLEILGLANTVTYEWAEADEHLARVLWLSVRWFSQYENLHVAEPLGAAATYIQMDLYTEMDLEEHPVSVPASPTHN